jgi:hypothetical protein
MYTKRDHLIDLLALALPFVEDAEDDDVYSANGKASIRKLAKDIRATVEEHGNESKP